VHGRYFLPLAAVPVVSATLLTTEVGRRSFLAFVPGSAFLLAYLVGKVATYFY
jgi:hypothetical protein